MKAWKKPLPGPCAAAATTSGPGPGPTSGRARRNGGAYANNYFPERGAASLRDLGGGAAIIYDAHVFNVGAAVGVDRLLGADANDWLYQNRLWFGLLFGLNLN